MRARTFIFWLGGTLGVLVYAALDLACNPPIQFETHLTTTPDWSRILDLAHWGGRLLHHGMISLLVVNSILIGGFIALIMTSIFGWFQKRSEVERYVGDDSEVP